MRGEKGETQFVDRWGHPGGAETEVLFGLLEKEKAIG